MPKCIVIGGGFGGMAAALRMRAKGYDVTLIDKQDQLGGRGYQYRRETPLGTFVHDAGPTVITAKFLFDELFELFGKRREDYVDFRDVYPWYRIAFADGTHFDYGGTLEQTLAEIRRIEPADADGYLRLLAHSKRIFDKGFTELGDQPFHDFYTMLKCAPDLARLGAWRTVYGMASKYINNEKLRRVFSFQPLLVGGNPFNTTSIYSLIQYLEREWGVQFAMGGTGAIVRGLEKLMVEEGVEIRLGVEVNKLHVERKTNFSDSIRKGGKSSFMVSGMRATDFDGPDVWQEHASIIVCNADPPHVYRNLIDAEHRPKWTDEKIDALKYSMGLFVLYFGTTKPYPGVAHHTIVLGESYKELLSRMFDKHELERHDLSVYLHRPTATDPSMAPAGCESFYVLVPVPNLQGGHDWDEIGPSFRDDVVAYLERTVLPGLSECITDDFYVTPNHFRDNLNTMHGTGFSVQPIFRQSAWFRFHNKSEDIDGLYFVGAGTHPGAGMPGVLCSAKVVDRMILPVGDGKHAPTLAETVGRAEATAAR